MILLVDIGNSYIKWATLNKGKLSHGDAAPRPNNESFAACASRWWGKLATPGAIVVANVAGAACADALSAWTREQWRLQPRILVAEHAAFGVVNAYNVPDRLGPDRWAALIAAHRHYPGPLCVIDAGTALTIDVTTGDGVHQGGLIVPGLALMRNVLLERTQGLRASTAAPVHGEASLFAHDTHDGINGGTLYALVATVDRIVADLAAELKLPLTRVITGGDAPVLLPLLAGNYHHAPDLVLKGLAIFAEES